MRRIAIAVMSTISGLVLLFSYHTSTGQANSAGALGSGGSGTGSGSSAANGAGSASGSGTGSSGASGSGTGSSGASGASGASGSGSANTGSGSSGSGSGSSSGGGTVAGDAMDTRWGPVQVRITVANGKIVSSEAVQYPNGNGRDMMINSYALPILNQQAVQAQSAQIDGVSGATVTSDGYRQSLQSAIDKAHLG
jgi:uncharacterized protein with FMN-binding domain